MYIGYLLLCKSTINDNVINNTRIFQLANYNEYNNIKDYDNYHQITLENFIEALRRTIDELSHDNYKENINYEKTIETIYECSQNNKWNMDETICVIIVTLCKTEYNIQTTPDVLNNSLNTSNNELTLLSMSNNTQKTREWIKKIIQNISKITKEKVEKNIRLVHQYKNLGGNRLIILVNSIITQYQKSNVEEKIVKYLKTYDTIWKYIQMLSSTTSLLTS
ncbi:hypothetical protein EBI_25277 [Enterocytozoon bieneusi H348]|nr:hypothetical protein EBI_25277 [Enterocytozoon bieneusi H348]|eukprot:XP_002650271.1 hypothetical protein EBI_25277 [Enterocytozoon bieneusi H348]